MIVVPSPACDAVGQLLYADTGCDYDDRISCCDVGWLSHHRAGASASHRFQRRLLVIRSPSDTGAVAHSREVLMTTAPAGDQPTGQGSDFDRSCARSATTLTDSAPTKLKEAG